METIEDGVGKHVVYSSFVKTGVTVTRTCLGQPVARNEGEDD
jgi:hypothetical protein